MVTGGEDSFLTMWGAEGGAAVTVRCSRTIIGVGELTHPRPAQAPLHGGKMLAARASGGWRQPSKPY